MTLPKKIGRYEVIGHIGTGGMSELLAAKVRGIRGFERKVAIKWMNPELASHGDFVRLFLAEACLSGMMHHPNVVQVYDVGEHDGRFYMLMEYVPGCDLRSLFKSAVSKGSALPYGVALQIIHGAAAGLHYAHEMTDAKGQSIGIVHRDVAPSNLFVSDDGFVKMLDFGLAGATGNDLPNGYVIGTVPYLSPERVRGLRADRRADIYGLGIILYELTTGQKLFRGGDPFPRIARGAIPRPIGFRRGYPPAIERIVMRAVHRDPSQRYQTALELQLDLEATATQLGLVMSALRVAQFAKRVCIQQLSRAPTSPWVSPTDRVPKQLPPERLPAASRPRPLSDRRL
jgi:serine/threonine protein kinase